MTTRHVGQRVARFHSDGSVEACFKLLFRVLFAIILAAVCIIVCAFALTNECYADDGVTDAGTASLTAGASGASQADGAGAGQALTQVDAADVLVKAKPKSKGWKKATAGEMAGTTANRALRGLKLSLVNTAGLSGSICYKAYLDGKGWTKTAKNGKNVSSSKKNVKAVKIWLRGSVAKKYDVYYRVYVRGYKWLDWAKNKKTAGVGKKMANKVTAIKVKLVAKDAEKPTPALKPQLKDKWQGLEFKYRDDDAVNEILQVRYTGGSKAKVVLRKKSGASWRTVVSCGGYVGRLGIGKAREGVDRTPAGDFGITQAFGIKGDPGAQLDYVKVDESMYWCGDRGPTYNKLIDINEHPHNCSGEHLIDYAPHYNYGLFFDYNTHPVKQGRGSAFFVHCTGGTPYTGGCIAVSQRNMIKIIRNVSDGARLCIYKK